MADTPLVSVVVPSYCHQDHVIDCLQSVHAQTWQRLELVVIDDASTDASWPRLQALFEPSFTARFERATLLRNDGNLGAHATLNRGISLSRGSHVALLNSDDLYHPGRIHRLMQALEDGGDIGRGGRDLAFSLAEIRVEGEGTAEIDPFFRLFTLRQHLALRRDPTVGLSLMRANHALSTGNLLFTRDLWDRAGPFLPLQYCHDWDFLLQALYFTEPAVVAEPLYVYRLHGANSFSALTHRQATELEITSRRFLRRGLSGRSPNPLFPSEANWPGFFEHFVKECKLDMHLRAEDGLGRKGWRIYE